MLNKFKRINKLIFPQNDDDPSADCQLGPSIKYVRKIFRKMLEMIVFQKTLRKYLVDGPVW